MSNLYTKHSFYLAGQRGETGEKGDTGEKGERGFRGYQGEQGISAYEVAVAEGFEGTIEDWLASLKGEKGDQGIQGIQGIQGNQGIQGVKGDKGDKGDMGRGLEVIDIVDTVNDLPKDLTEDNYGDCYMVGENLYMFGSSGWTNLGAVTTKFLDEYTSMGKTIIADAITDKGVHTSPDDTFPEMGFNIKQIYQNRPIVTGSDAIMENTDKSMYDVKKFRSEISQVKNPLIKEKFDSTTGDFLSVKQTDKYKFLLSERLLLRVTNEGEMLSVGYVFAKQMALDTTSTRIAVIYGLGEGTEGGKLRILDQALDGTKHTLELSKTPTDVYFNSKGQLVVSSLNEITIYNVDYTVANTIHFDTDVEQILVRNDGIIIAVQNNGQLVSYYDDKGKVVHKIETDITGKYVSLKYLINEYDVLYAYGEAVTGQLSLLKLNNETNQLDLITNVNTEARQVVITRNNVFYLFGETGIFQKVNGNGKMICNTLQGANGGDKCIGYYPLEGNINRIYTVKGILVNAYEDEFKIAWELDIEGIDGVVTNVSDEEPVGPTIPEGMEGVAVFKDGSERGIKNTTFMQKLFYDKPTYPDTSKTLPLAFIATNKRMPQDSDANVYAMTSSDAPQHKLIKMSPTLDLVKSIDIVGTIEMIDVCKNNVYLLRSSTIYKYDLDLNEVGSISIGTASKFIKAEEVTTETGETRVVIIATTLGETTKIIRIYDEELKLIVTYNASRNLKSIGIGKDSYVYVGDTEYITKYKLTDLNKMENIVSIKYLSSGTFDMDITVGKDFIVHKVATNMIYLPLDLSFYRGWQIESGITVNNYIVLDSGILYCVAEKSIFKANITGNVYWKAPFTIGNKLLNIVRNGEELRAIAESYSYSVTDVEMNGIEVAVLDI